MDGGGVRLPVARPARGAGDTDPCAPDPDLAGGYAAAAVARAGRLADGHLVGRDEPHIVEAASAQLAAVRDPADPGFTRGLNLTCVLHGTGADSARAAFVRQQRAYEEIQAGRIVYSGLVGAARADVDAYVQVAGVVAGVRAVLDRLRDWADVHVVLRVLFPEPDLGVQLARLATFGRDVLPRLRQE